eukprot:CAMPEP_0176325646 /NCGR_PEP_ID=MMETSP0121_2-20121125/73519_1 /TAXON_ID=160619 /ORGANISM="Kryptoperidinium foliaceum, Strain CCMP 1326" /LENGTH=165 /DNA_ID=CAMNT_0017668221 /DNA_START=75 /DNA_END=570 /DNA_ORIENTATION=+
MPLGAARFDDARCGPQRAGRAVKRPSHGRAARVPRHAESAESEFWTAADIPATAACRRGEQAHNRLRGKRGREKRGGNRARQRHFSGDRLRDPTHQRLGIALHAAVHAAVRVRRHLRQVSHDAGPCLRVPVDEGRQAQVAAAEEVGVLGDLLLDDGHGPLEALAL